MTDTLPQTKKSDEKFCHECGGVIRAKAEICPKCGVRQHDAPIPYALPAYTPPPERSRLAAALLAIILGWLGAHKFYLGRPVAGFIYLVLFWTGISLVLGIIEGICYLSMSESEFQSKYGSRRSGSGTYAPHPLPFGLSASELPQDTYLRIAKAGTVLGWVACIFIIINLIIQTVMVVQEKLPASNPNSLLHGHNLYLPYCVLLLVLIAACPATRPLIKKLTGLNIGMITRFAIFFLGMALGMVFFSQH